MNLGNYSPRTDVLDTDVIVGYRGTQHVGLVRPESRWTAATLLVKNSRVVATIAALKAVVVTGMATGYAAGVIAYTTSGDGGGGQFIFDSTSAVADNGGTVIAPNSGTGRWLRPYSGAVNIRWFGAKIDGSNDTTAIAAAITEAGPGGALYFPKGSGNIKISTKLTQLASQKWFSDGGQRAVTIEKAANIDLIDMASLAEISDLNFDAKGATYTGKTIAVGVGAFSPKIKRIRFVDSAGVGIYFAADAGGGAQIHEIEGTTTSPLTVAAIGIAGDTTACPRFFSNIWLSGGMLDLSGCNDQFVVNAYVHHIVTSSTSAQLYAANVRYASAGAEIGIQGTDCKYVNCAFAGLVRFTNCQGVSTPGCDFGFGFIHTEANCQYNAIWNQTTQFAITWNQPSGTQPVLGNGTLTCWFTRNGYLCTYYFKLVMGASTTFGNGATAYQFSLPHKGHQSIDQRGFICHVYDASGPAGVYDHTVFGAISANGEVLTLGVGAGAVRDGAPIAWAAGDIIEGHFTFMCR